MDKLTLVRKWDWTISDQQTPEIVESLLQYFKKLLVNEWVSYIYFASQGTSGCKCLSNECDWSIRHMRSVSLDSYQNVCTWVLSQWDWVMNDMFRSDAFVCVSTHQTKMCVLRQVRQTNLCSLTFKFWDYEIPHRGTQMLMTSLFDLCRELVWVKTVLWFKLYWHKMTNLSSYQRTAFIRTLR